METTTVDYRARAIRTIPDSGLLTDRARAELSGQLPMDEGELYIHKTYELGLGRRLVPVASMDDGLAELVVAWRGRRVVPAGELLYQDSSTDYLYVLVLYGPDEPIGVHPELPGLVDLPRWLMDAVSKAPDQDPPPAAAEAAAPPRRPEVGPDAGPGLLAAYTTSSRTVVERIVLDGVREPRCARDVSELERTIERRRGGSVCVISWQVLPGRG